MYVGLDIGSTNIRYSFTSNLEIPTKKYFCNTFVKYGDAHTEIENNICKIINLKNKIDGIAISLAANIDRLTWKIKTWPNNPSWNGYDLKKHLTDLYNIPIIIEDDANCGAIGEYSKLKKQENSIVYITLGTGVGCGIIIDGKLYHGEHGLAGELGHVYIDNSNKTIKCSCGEFGCLQSIISGYSIQTNYNLNTGNCVSSVSDIINKANFGDLEAIYYWQDIKKTISNTIYNLVMLLDISTYVIGGGISTIIKDFVLDIEKDVNKKLSKFQRSIKVYESKLEDNSGVYGALLLLKKYIEDDKNEKSSNNQWT